MYHTWFIAFIAGALIYTLCLVQLQKTENQRLTELLQNQETEIQSHRRLRNLDQTSSLHQCLNSYLIGDNHPPASDESLKTFIENEGNGHMAQLATVCRKDEKGRRKYDCPRPASQTGKRKEMDLYYYPHKSQAYHGDSLVDMRYLQDPYNCPDCHNDTVLQNRRVGGRIISVDEIVHGYQILFERLQMYSYINFMGVPMQQDPNDAFALMDMIWRIKPDVIIEMGTAGGGSSFFYSFVMSGYNSDAHLITFDPKRVVDWNRNDIRKICPHCIDAKETPLWKSGKIKFFNADPVDKVDETRQLLRKWRAKTVMVIEDGNHLYPTVYRNINAYAQFVTPGSYLVVQDTKMDSISPFYEPESPSEIPFTATEDNSPTMAPIDPREQGTPIDVVDRFLEEPNGKDFERDRRFEYFLFSNHLKGFLKRVR